MHRSASKREFNRGWLLTSACLLLAACLFGHAAYKSTAAPPRSALAAVKTAPATRTIEEFRVCDRVAPADNPAEEFDESLGDVDPPTWRKVVLRPGPGSLIETVRPKAWIDQQFSSNGGRMFLSVPEIGIHGDAEIVSIGPCPPLKPGKGRLVLSTFHHWADETIELHLESLAEPIRCTPQHATWSHDRQEFVEAQSLQPGEQVLGVSGPIRVTKTVHISQPIEVFNLEVQGQHVYQVSAAGVLVHNFGADGCGVVYLRTNPITGRQYVGKAQSMARYLARQGEHDRALGVNHIYDILGHADDPLALSLVEESTMRARGGAQSAGGTLENLIRAMSEERFLANGGAP